MTSAPLHPSGWTTTLHHPTASSDKPHISKSEFSNVFAHTGQGHLHNLLLVALLYKKIGWVGGCIVYAICFGYEIRGSLHCSGLVGYGLDGQGWVFVRNEVWTFVTSSTPIFCGPPNGWFRDGAVGWSTALQAGRSRVRFPMVSLEFFIDTILLAALWPWVWISL